MTTHIQHETRNQLLKIAVLTYTVVLSPTLSAETPTAEEIKNISANWVCKWCPYPDNSVTETEVTAGAGYVSNDSYKHGDYTGLEDKGAYLIGGTSDPYLIGGTNVLILLSYLIAWFKKKG